MTNFRLNIPTIIATEAGKLSPLMMNDATPDSGSLRLDPTARSLIGSPSLRSGQGPSTTHSSLQLASRLRNTSSPKLGITPSSKPSLSPQAQLKVFLATYTFPAANYIQLLFGDDKSMLLNPNCQKQRIFDFLLKVVNFPKGVGADDVDMCDMTGNLAGMRYFYLYDNVKILFTMRQRYIPCVVTINDEGFLASVSPCLTDWETKYPQMADKIKRKIEAEKTGADAERESKKEKEPQKEKGKGEGDKEKKKKQK